MLTRETIEAAVIAHYLETGEPATASDIGARVGMSPQSVGRAMRSPPATLQTRQIMRDAKSRDYPGFLSGRQYAVTAYLPRVELLRAYILTHGRA